VPVFPGDLFLGEAYGRGYAIVKPHCHGVDCRRFSQTDDVSDKSLFSAVTSLLLSLEAVRAVAERDVLFGSMDGVEGRHVLNRLVLSIRCRIFDVGVRLFAFATRWLRSRLSSNGAKCPKAPKARGGVKEGVEA
jgi:hypothetical protein